jgi:hypothetical protein
MDEPIDNRNDDQASDDEGSPVLQRCRIKNVNKTKDDRKEADGTKNSATYTIPKSETTDLWRKTPCHSPNFL